ncbi:MULTISPECIES: hypothetical protein [Arthrobacter]|uniref:Uncharacterized protein n=2 Tax=Arthrobacter TaxID=1663 RepID=A0ABU9KKF5_9MICC|nr:hypothetical protein [Arthrobacter sp. YJM1]MDP5226585.1 hypothetical protein [Arthrobacter sp. YJM1]
MSRRATRRHWPAGLAALGVLALLLGGTMVWGIGNGDVDGLGPSAPSSTPPTPKSSAASAAYTPVACVPSQATATPAAVPAVRPATRAVNIGFEDLVSTQPGHLQALEQHLNAVDANAVQIAIGRLDWLAFSWPGHPDRSVDQVFVDGRDLVQEALDALSCDAQGHRRQVTLSIDALIGRLFTQNPQLAGRNVDGKASTLFGSVTAWSHGELGDELVDLAGAVARRFHPDFVNITELMFFTETYGADDKADYLAVTGRSDWPRTADGTIDVNDPSIGAWRSAAVEQVMARVSAATRAAGVPASMDVNYPLTAGVAGRPDAGQDAVALLRVTDGLNLWYYPGMLAGSVPGIEQVDRDFVERYPGRVSVSLGLWFSGHPGIGLEEFRHELGRVDALGVKSVSVTPASMMTDARWAVLQQAWAG